MHIKKECLKIAFYGKGGIGKSTVAANVSCAMALKGKKVLHIGCDPKGDSTRCIYGKRILSVLDILRERRKIERDNIIYKGFMNVSCIEAGGPEPGIGCAGRGIITMMEELEALEIFEENFDVIVFDVLGDVVCGGFGVPMREGYADKIYIVTTSEFMSLYAANNIIKSIEKFSEDSDIALGGIIHNKRNVFSDSDIVKSFSKKTNSKVIHEVEYSDEISIAELNGKTVIEQFRNGDSSKEFLKLSEKILKNSEDNIPKAMNNYEFEEFSRQILKHRLDNIKK